jgi:hypothetical protein
MRTFRLSNNLVQNNRVQSTSGSTSRRLSEVERIVNQDHIRICTIPADTKPRIATLRPSRMIIAAEAIGSHR